VNGKLCRHLWARSSSRNVYSFDNYVIKIHGYYNDHGGGPSDSQSWVEYQAYKKLSPYWRRFAAKVYAYGTIKVSDAEDGYVTDYVIQERIKGRHLVQDSYSNKWFYAEAIFEKLEIRDFHSDNFVFANGKLKILDLGCGEY
jgi:hypothetical protein